MWPETLPRVRFASRLPENSPEILHLVAFHVKSPTPCHIPHIFTIHRPQLSPKPQLGESACRRTHKPYRKLSLFWQPPSGLLSPLAIFFPRLSGAISPLADPVCPLSATASKLRLPRHPLSPSKPPLQRHSLRLSHNIHILRPSILKAGWSKTCFEQSLR